MREHFRTDGLHGLKELIEALCAVRDERADEKKLPLATDDFDGAFDATFFASG